MEDKDDKENEVENSEKIESVKVALIGSSSVGKTSIIQRFSENTFSENPKVTVGIGFTQKFLKINNQTIQCNIWDTAGTEKYRSMGKKCYKDAYIVCLVYDISNEQSFKEIETVWYPNLKENGEKYKIVALVGNKNDLYNECECVDEEKARNYATKINASFFLTSAKNGFNIDILFESLMKKYLDPKFIINVKSLKNEKGKNVKLKKNSKDSDKKSGCCLFK